MQTGARRYVWPHAQFTLYIEEESNMEWFADWLQEFIEKLAHWLEGNG
jgi:hypothetical protein